MSIEAFSKPLDEARKTIESWQNRDADQIPQLDDLINSSASTSYTLPQSQYWNSFIKSKTINLPDSLFEQYNKLQCHCLMGLFPQIQRAWITIDNKLFLWNYVDGTDFASFEELPEIIVSVGLVKPKSGVFVDSINHLLVICTPSSIQLLGVSSQPNGLSLYQTAISVNTDGIDMIVVDCTESGRIFLTGSDSCLYELKYQSEEGWFKSRCSLINHSSSTFTNLVPSFLKSNVNDPIINIAIDNSRNCLYTLSSKSIIELYHLGKDDNNLTKIATASDIGRQASMLFPSYQPLDQNLFSIKKIFVISPSESSSIHLVAITSTGVRLYFTHNRRSYGFYVNSTNSSTLTGLELLHVRPPPNVTNVNNNVNQNVNESESIYYNNGLYINASPNSEDFDSLLCVGQDNGTASVNLPQQTINNLPTTTSTTNIRPSLVESASNVIIEGRTWSINEQCHPLSDGDKLPQSLRKQISGKEFNILNELSIQFNFKPRRFLILTNMGLTIIAKQRPVDILRNILQSTISTSNRDQEIVSFFNNFGKDQSCAMALAIAVGNPLALSIGDDFDFDATVNDDAILSSDVTQNARRLFYDFGGKPVLIDRGYPTTTTNINLDALSPNTEIIFSGRHNGLALYLSRLLRPIWNERVTKLSSSNQNLKKQVSNLSDKTLMNVQRNLADLQIFLKSNQQLFATSLLDNRDKSDQSAWRAEHNSLIGLDNLITQCIEGISFILLLIDYQISEILTLCDQNLQEQILNLTYKDLLTNNNGKEIARNVVNELINQQISKQISIDAISEILQQRCGTFCSADDVLLYKAIENVRKAHESKDENERESMLKESLRLFSKASKNLSIDKLREVTNEYKSLKYYIGSIDLSLSCAKEWDNLDLGLQFWAEGRGDYFKINYGNNESVGFEVPIEFTNDNRLIAFKYRQSCYECIFDTLIEVNKQFDQAITNHENIHQMEYYKSITFRRAIESDDPVFHSCLYDWLLSQGYTDTLLDIQSPFIEAHLIRDPLTLVKCELLWQFYVRRSRFNDAARVLASLADSVEFPLSLSRRLEYLSLALSNAKSQQKPLQNGLDVQSVEFLTDVEEKIEVAQVQVEIYRSVKDHREISEEVRNNLLNELENRLFNISELFCEFAEPLALLEIQLLIFHIADHYDANLVTQTWHVLIEHIHYVNRQLDESERYEAVSNVVYNLAKRFYPSKISFPLDTVINILEQYSYENGVKKSGWIPLTLNEAGIPFGPIFEVYFNMFESKIPPWQNQSAIIFLISDIVILLQSWLNQFNQSSSTFGFPIRKVDECISEYLATLSSAPYLNVPTNVDITSLRERLTDVQKYLRTKF